MKKLLLTLALFFVANCFEVPPELSSVCPKGCKRYYRCDPVEQKCVYKGFFPVYPLEIVEIICLSISSALATACGIGGGTVYSSFILGVQEFEPNEAFPISNCLILTCGLVTFFACVIDKNKHPKNKFVDYDIAIIFGPAMILGSKFGTIFNKIFSSLFLTVAVIIVLLYSITSTYKNYVKRKAKEEKERLEEMELGNTYKDLTNPLLGRKENPLTEEQKELLGEDNKAVRYDRILFILMLEVVVIVDQFLEGNAKLPSFIGIRRCSSIYWTIFISHAVISILFLYLAYSVVQQHITKKTQLNPNYKDLKMKNLSDHLVKVVFVAILAGIISSMVGIGGGMITNPMFATLGLDPKESSSTSNFLIITTAIASTFLFSFAGQLNYSFTFWMLIPCTICAFIGSFFILEYINRTKRSSILLGIMVYFLIASLFILLFKGYFDLQDQSVMNLFTINSFC